MSFTSNGISQSAVTNAAEAVVHIAPPYRRATAEADTKSAAIITDIQQKAAQIKRKVKQTDRELTVQDENH